MKKRMILFAVICTTIFNGCSSNGSDEATTTSTQDEPATELANRENDSITSDHIPPPPPLTPDKIKIRWEEFEYVKNQITTNTTGSTGSIANSKIFAIAIGTEIVGDIVSPNPSVVGYEITFALKPPKTGGRHKWKVTKGDPTLNYIVQPTLSYYNPAVMADTNFKLFTSDPKDIADQFGYKRLVTPVNAQGKKDTIEILYKNK